MSGNLIIQNLSKRFLPNRPGQFIYVNYLYVLHPTQKSTAILLARMLTTFAVITCTGGAPVLATSSAHLRVVNVSLACKISTCSPLSHRMTAASTGQNQSINQVHSDRSVEGKGPRTHHVVATTSHTD